MSRMRTVACLMVVVVLSVLAGPALAQDPYPPPPPEGDGPVDVTVEVEVACSDDGEGRAVTARVEGFLAGSSATVEIRAEDSGHTLATHRVDVDGNGRATLQATLPDDDTQPRVALRVTGRDAEDGAVTESRVVDAEASGCHDDGGVGVAAEVETEADADVAAQHAGLAAPAFDRDDDGSLAYTGHNIVLLLVIALVLATLGAVLVRFRTARSGAGGRA